MKQFETEHYIFSYHENSKAEADIAAISVCQEACFQYICGVLKLKPDFRIHYFLCDSPEDVGRVYGDDDPCNGFVDLPSTIYAVYNDAVQCIGFHEDAHVLSYTINWPDCRAIKEGLAMYFDRKWWGIQNMDWAGFFLKKGLYIPVDQLLNNEIFWDVDCSISYPIMGAFTDYLIATYGIDSYLAFYRHQDMVAAMEEVFRKTPAELNRDFVSYLRLFAIDPVLESRMDALLV